MVGVAVNVTELPEAAGLVPLVRAMLTAGATEALMVMVIELLVAVVGLAQLRLDVITHDTIAPLVRVVVVYVAEFVPTLAPLTCH